MSVSSKAMTLFGELVSQPSSAEVSLASPTVLQENAWHLLMNVISRENSSVLLGRLNPDGSLLRMSRGSAQASLDGSLENSSMIFQKWGIVSDGEVGELSMLELATEGSGSSLLLSTPMASDAAQGEVIGKGDRFYQPKSGRWRKITKNGVDGSCGLAREMMMLPTPRANENDQGNHEAIKEAGSSWKGQKRGATVSTIIAMLPTPTSRDHKGGTVERVENGNPKRALDCEMQVHGLKLQPAFAEWMMGFPEGWTALDASGTRLSRSRSIQSSKQSQILKEASSK